MTKFYRIVSLLSLLLVITSCSKEEVECSVVTNKPILFGVEKIAQTKIDYNGVSASFENGENIGIYAFYNNFYYYYTEYSCFAESVIFANQGVTLDGSGGAIYEPMRSWTFSTLYGTAPHTLDCIAYYPFKEGYNPTFINMITINNVPTFEYYYVSVSSKTTVDDNNIESTVVTKTPNSDIDFMTAHTRYDYSQKSSEFRTDMLSNDCIPLTFTRHIASMNLKVTKPDGYANQITVTGLTIYFDAYEKFIQNIDATSSFTWDNMTSDYSLTATKTCNTTLAETLWNSTPSEDSTLSATNLLEEDNLLFFPPKTEILKIEFTILDDDAEKSYTWHPHIAEIVANKHYTLNLELDPARAN